MPCLDHEHATLAKCPEFSLMGHFPSKHHLSLHCQHSLLLLCNRLYCRHGRSVLPGPVLLLVQVRGVEALRVFSQNLMKAYVPPPAKVLSLEGGSSSMREAELQAQVSPGESVLCCVGS
jgi:hypothetical protein